MRLIKIFKCNLNIVIQHQWRSLIGRVKIFWSNQKPKTPKKSYVLQVAKEIISFEATTYQKAISYSIAKEWAMAMNEKMESL